MPKNNSPKSPRRGRERNARIRAHARTQPDLVKIAFTMQALAIAQAEKDAQAQAEARQEKSS
jgi:hypothetical protein